MPAQRFRLSPIYAVFYKDRVTRLRFTIRKLQNETLAPLDLTAYDAIKFRAFQDDSTPALIANATLTPLSAAADKIDSVVCRCEGTVTFAAVLSAIRCQVELHLGGAIEIADAQWEADVVVGGATS